MLYIHELRHLSLKTADIESVYLIRDIKGKTPYPLQQDTLFGYWGDFLFSHTDKQMMEQSLELLQPTVEMVEALLSEDSSLYEAINLERAIGILRSLPEPVRKNISYCDEILAWQEPFISFIIPVLNNIPKSKGVEDERRWKQDVNSFFEKVLRNGEFGFNYSDVLSETQLAAITGLHESMTQGFFFHVTIEEELKKINYDTIRGRLPQEKVQAVEAIRENVEIIKKGIERGYQGNMRMVNWALVMFAYVRWLGNKWETFSR